MRAMKMRNRERGQLLKICWIFLFNNSPSFAERLPFSAFQMGICEFAKGNTEANKSLRSLYSCKDKIIIITNTSNKIILVHDIVLNEYKCRNHLFLNGEWDGPLKSGEKIAIATSCKIVQIDLRIDKDRFQYKF